MFLAKSFIPWIVLASALRLGAAQEKLLAEKDNGERMHNKLKPNSPLATLDHPGEHPGESPILPEPISAPKVLKSRADTGSANAFNALGAPLDHPGGHSGETPDQPDPAITPSDHPGEHLGETPSLPAPAPAPLDHPGEHTGETPSPPAPLDHPGEHTGETPSPPAPALAPLDHPGEHLGESPNPPPSAPVPLLKVLGTRALTNLASNEVEQNEGNVITASLRNPGKLSANSPAPVPLPALKLSTSRVEVSQDANGGNQVKLIKKLCKKYSDLFLFFIFFGK
ncbi:expressed protein [Phakopsora pachyrhizi]|uniref:Expressed protein n=1 Tax=Phakopsora pachyrhizi TaxID=170000 RepID=A0AAV0AZU3_PHAPC|nr:expressed protein [Phakopsora pachyrhizi]